jgi:hypothetical protein
MTYEVVYCEDCDLSLRVKHDADYEVYPIMYCPVCGTATTGDDRYQHEDEEEDE